MESHIVIQHRTVLDNVDSIRDKFPEIDKGEAAKFGNRRHIHGDDRG